MTWIGRLSAAVSSRPSAVRMTQEKSWPELSTPERAVRNRVLAILRAIGVEPAGEDRHAHAIGAYAVVGRPDHAGSPAQAVIARLPAAVRLATAPGSSTTVVNEDSMIAGPATVVSGATSSNRLTVASTQPPSAK